MSYANSVTQNSAPVDKNSTPVDENTTSNILNAIVKQKHELKYFWNNLKFDIIRFFSQIKGYEISTERNKS